MLRSRRLSCDAWMAFVVVVVVVCGGSRRTTGSACGGVRRSMDIFGEKAQEKRGQQKKKSPRDCGLTVGSLDG
jgi:hypothetical protein